MNLVKVHFLVWIKTSWFTIESKTGQTFYRPREATQLSKTVLVNLISGSTRITHKRTTSSGFKSEATREIFQTTLAFPLNYTKMLIGPMVEVLD